MIRIFEPGPWQMTAGERCALEGLISQLKPETAIEIGTAEGGSLRCIAAHAGTVHSFDLVEPQIDLSGVSNAVIHTGDSHAALPAELARLTAEGTNVEFALVDGDHTVEGVRQDIEDLLSSPAIGRSMILIHDTANNLVRSGIEAVDYAAHTKVRVVDLDFVPGYLVKTEVFHHEKWGGLGLLIVDDSDSPAPAPHLISAVGYPQPLALESYRRELEGDLVGPAPVAEVPDPPDPALAGLEQRVAALEAQAAAVPASLKRLLKRLPRR